MARVLLTGEQLGGRQVPREVLTDSPGAFLFDLDGTLYTEAGPIPGAVEALRSLRRRGVPFRYVTNTTRIPRRQLVDRLRGYGFPVEPDDVVTAVSAGAEVLRREGAQRVAAFVQPDVLEEFAGFDAVGPDEDADRVDAVVLGDLGDAWNHRLLTKAFRYVMGGARPIALQRNRYWAAADGLQPDAGAYVAALEYATGARALLCGKPDPEFFAAAAEGLGRGTGAAPQAIAMLGDDLWADVEGAQRAGLLGWLVRTGKFRPEALEGSSVVPDRMLDSAAAVAALEE